MQLPFLTTGSASCYFIADNQFVYPYHTLKSLSHQPGKFDEYEKFLSLFFVMS